MSPNDVLRLDDFWRPSRAAAVASLPMAGPTLAAAERALIERALESTNGNKLQAARQLGISRTRLYAKMAKLGLVNGSDGGPPKV